MPQKRNSAGNMQNYVPAGNGDSSGEYGDNASGSNKHYKSQNQATGQPSITTQANTPQTPKQPTQPKNQTNQNVNQTQQNQQPNQAQQPTPKPQSPSIKKITPSGKDWSDFQDMDAKAVRQFYRDLNNNADINQSITDMGLRGNYTQRLITAMGLDDKPKVLSDADFDAMLQDNPDMIPIYRGVSGSGGMTSQMVTNQTMKGNDTRIGTGIHGDGIYFTTNYNYASGYQSNGRDPMTAVVDKTKLKAITERDLDIMIQKEPDSWLRRVSDDDGDKSTYALYKGYNCIIAEGGNYGDKYDRKKKKGEDYYILLSREPLIFRKNPQRYNAYDNGIY